MNRTANKFALLLASALITGCSAPWLGSYEVEHFTRYRIDNPDGDNLWDTGDVNGNGMIDDNEAFSPLIDFDQRILPGPSQQPTTSSRFLASTSSAIAKASPVVNTTRLGSVAFVPFRGINVYSATGTFDITTARNVGTDGAPTVRQIVYYVDFDDLRAFNVAFNTSESRSQTEVRGVQLVQVHRFSEAKDDKEDEPKQTGPNEFIEVSYGPRYFRQRNSFFWEGRGGMLGRSFTDTIADDRLAGPQVAVDWVGQRLGWTLNAGAAAMIGYGDFESHQVGAVGEDFTPGAANRTAPLTPGIVAYRQERQRYSSLAELRADATYKLTRELAFRLGYTAFYYGNLRQASDSVNWTLPDLGLVDNGGDATLINSLHASIEWRR